MPAILSVFALFAYMAIGWCLTALFARIDLVTVIASHPWGTALWVGAYFVIGFIWSFAKWWIFVNSIAEKYRVKREEFIGNYTAQYQSAVPSQSLAWNLEVLRSGIEKPTVAKYKSKITVWVMYWPLSVIWSLIDDFVKKAFRQIITSLQRFYQFISDKAFKKFDF
jgi:hypothetical protein